MKWIREPFKESWDEVRRRSPKEAKAAPYLSYDEFRKLCDAIKSRTDRSKTRSPKSCIIWAPR